MRSPVVEVTHVRIARDERQRPYRICFSFTGLVQRGGGTGPHKEAGALPFTKVKAVAHLKIRNQL